MRPSRPKVFLVTTAGFFLILFAIFVMIAAFCGKGFPVLTGIVGSVLAASGFGLFSAIMFTPAEIDWDDEGIRLRGIFPGDGDYPWEKLEAYSPVLWGVFGLQSFKFEGQRMPYQIEVAGFNRRERKAFQQFLRERFPEKRRWVLVGFSRRK